MHLRLGGGGSGVLSDWCEHRNFSSSKPHRGAIVPEYGEGELLIGPGGQSIRGHHLTLAATGPGCVNSAVLLRALNPGNAGVLCSAAALLQSVVVENVPPPTLSLGCERSGFAEWNGSRGQGCCLRNQTNQMIPGVWSFSEGRIRAQVWERELC